MFETQENAEILLPELNLTDSRWWDYVQLNLEIHWFHVVHQLADSESFSIAKISFLPHIDQFLKLHQDSKFQINKVSLVSPGHLNGTDDWMMEPLAEIHTGTEPGIEEKHLAYVFVMKNGNRYVYSTLSTEEKLLKKKHLLYKN